MRYVALLLTALLFSCNGKEAKPAEGLEDRSAQATVLTDEKCDTDFDVFFKKFGSDSIFQKQHVKFPLKNTFLDMEGDLDVIRKDIKENEYRFSNFKKDNETGDAGGNGSYKVNIKKEKDSVYYNLTGIDNGIATVVKFVFINGCWYMVAIEDSST